ncbi:hypothetical protein SAMD00019534_071510 [Acytostelium subglobosum LB1]|uniref:hypothetical protein n=1 Tax=Acytostelium subglobosum LB1 TaxID=1410327 RepID=UPI000644AC40|nr:hypothetical protein SAMD00019534_071510 [Acytostelium subglobosum LB1]GAM23976.1 hypothetical protein SAMD00019534_071510 [Acytostelium subglobosum LB1]|eukprot:XP_012753012.1 hypothetical protein SAMD00019534_071510 [Acytostelium subglobosum LB1]
MFQWKNKPGASTTGPLGPSNPLENNNNNNNVSDPLGGGGGSSTPSSSIVSSSASSTTDNSLIQLNGGGNSSSNGNASALVVTILQGTPIPHNSEGHPILLKLVRYLHTKGTSLEHVFKVQSHDFNEEFQLVKKNLLRDISVGDGEQVQLSSLTNNPHVVAELLKQYLLYLPEPLFTYQLYDSFLLTNTILSKQDKLWAYRFLMAYLPQGFRATIKNVLGLLSKIHSNNSVTKMDSQQLAMIFARAFLRPEEEMYYMKQDRIDCEDILRLWIEEFDAVTRPAVSAPAPALSHHHHQLPHVAHGKPHAAPAHPLAVPSSSTSAASQSSEQHHPLIDPLSSQVSTPISIIGQLVNSSNINNINTQQQQQDSPRPSLPTIPKHNNIQQTTSIIDIRPKQTNKLQKQAQQTLTPSITTAPTPQPPTTIIEEDTITTANTPSSEHSTPTKSPSPAPIESEPTVQLPTITTTPSLHHPPSSSSNQSTPPDSPVVIHVQTAPALNAPSTPNPSLLGSIDTSSWTLLSTLDTDATQKISKIKATIESLISEHLWGQLRTTVKCIANETNYSATIKLSTTLRDSKKHLVESCGKHLGIAKSDVKSFLQQFDKPPTYSLPVLSLEQLANPPATTAIDEFKLFELKRATHQTVEDITDYLYCLKTKLHTYIYKDQVIHTAQIASKLRSILDPNSQRTLISSSGSLTMMPSVSPSPTSPDTSRSLHHSTSSLSSPEPTPPASPSVVRRRGGASHLENKIQVDTSAKRIVDHLNSIKLKLTNAEMAEAIEIGKVIRATKQTMNELYAENNYAPPPEVVIAPSTPDEEQLVTLKKAMEPLLERIFIQIDTVCANVNQVDISEQESFAIIDKLTFINKVLAL